MWKFSLDPLEIGEKEKWYLPDGHIYEQRIRIPGSWQSLRAFGEEFLADDYSLHQASAFRCNWREQGSTAWMQTTISVENDTRVQLVLGAVSGIAKVWLEEKEIGCTVDFYSPCRFRLGRLKAGRSYTLTVKVLYPFEGDQCCFGKQGFWFTDSPGIWQNVWLEEERKVWISDILVDNYCREDDGIRFCGRVEAEVNPEIMSVVRTIFQRDQIQNCGHGILRGIPKVIFYTVWISFTGRRRDARRQYWNWERLHFLWSLTRHTAMGMTA